MSLLASVNGTGTIPLAASPYQNIQLTPFAASLGSLTSSTFTIDPRPKAPTVVAAQPWVAQQLSLAAAAQNNGGPFNRNSVQPYPASYNPEVSAGTQLDRTDAPANPFPTPTPLPIPRPAPNPTPGPVIPLDPAQFNQTQRVLFDTVPCRTPFFPAPVPLTYIQNVALQEAASGFSPCLVPSAWPQRLGGSVSPQFYTSPVGFGMQGLPAPCGGCGYRYGLNFGW